MYRMIYAIALTLDQITKRTLHLPLGYHSERQQYRITHQTRHQYELKESY